MLYLPSLLKMKIVFTHDEKSVFVGKDYTGATTGLLGQLIAELEIIKQELLDIYDKFPEEEDEDQ